MLALSTAYTFLAPAWAAKIDKIPVPQPIIDNIYNQANVVHSGSTGGQLAWPAMLRKAYRLDPSFAQ